MAAKTIGRNATRRIASLKETHTHCVVRSLGNGFTGVECSADYAWSELDRFDFAKVRDDGDHITIRVHSNLWYELRPAP